MGLNWAEGFAAAGKGLQLIAGNVARREEQEVEQLRQENMARLQDRLASARDQRNHEQALERDKQNFTQQKDLQGETFKQQDKLDRNRDARAERAAQRADARQSEREGRAGDQSQRRFNEDRLEQWTQAHDQATQDFLRAQSELTKIGSDPFADPAGASAASNPQAQSLYELMRDARQRQLRAKRQLEVWNRRVAPDMMGEAKASQQPSPFATTNEGLIPMPAGISMRPTGR